MTEANQVELVSPVPLSPELSEARVSRYASAWPNAQVTLVGIDAEEPLPARLETEEDIATVSRAFGEALGDGTRIADCMLDPGVELLEGRGAPGLFARIVRGLTAHGRQVVLASRNEAMRDRMRFLIEYYEAEAICPRAYSLDIPAEHAFSSERWEAAIAELRVEGEKLPVLACCTGVHFDPMRAAELDAHSPYELLGGALEEERNEGE